MCRVAPDEDAPKVAVDDKDGKFLALRLSFALPTSSYATMCIRELMKSSSSQAAHKAMTLGDDEATDRK